MTSVTFSSIYPQIRKLSLHDLEMTVLFSHLLIKASKKQLTNYRTPAQAMGLFSAGLGGHLEELFKLNVELKEPLYGSLVVNKESGLPSKGFFDAAIRHKLQSKFDSEKVQEEYWNQEKERVFRSMTIEQDFKKIEEIAPDLTDDQKIAILKILKK